VSWARRVRTLNDGDPDILRTWDEKDPGVNGASYRNP